MTDIFKKAQKGREEMEKNIGSIKGAHEHFKKKSAAHEALMKKKEGGPKKIHMRDIIANARRKNPERFKGEDTSKWPKADGKDPNHVSDKERSEHQRKIGRSYHD